MQTKDIIALIATFIMFLAYLYINGKAAMKRSQRSRAALPKAKPTVALKKDEHSLPLQKKSLPPMPLQLDEKKSKKGVAHLLRDKSTLQKAFILQEVLKRHEDLG